LLDEARKCKDGADFGGARTRIAAAIEKALADLRTREDAEAIAFLAELGTFAHDAGELGAAAMARRRVLDVCSNSLPDEHADLQKARADLATTLYLLGDLQGARGLFQSVLEVASRILSDDHPDLQGARQNLAVVTVTLGDLQGARALQEKVLEVYSRTLPDDDPRLQLARGNLADTIRTLGDLHGALSLEEKVLEVRSRTLPDDHPDLQMARANLAITAYVLGDRPRARALFEKVLEVFSRTLPDDHPNLQMARQSLAVVIGTMGDIPGARALQEKVLEVNLRTLPDDHPNLQMARANLADTIQHLGDIQAARALEEKVLEVRSRTLPEEHPDLQTARGNLAATLCLLGDLQGGRALMEKVLEVRSRTLPDDHPDLQAARENLAAVISALGDFEGSRALQEKVLEVRSRTLPDDHPDLQGSRLNLAAVILELGDLEGAQRLQEKVLEIASRTLTEEDQELQRARESLATTRRALGDLEGARSLQEKVLAARSRMLPDDHALLQVTRVNLASLIAASSGGRLDGDRARTAEREAANETCEDLILSVGKAQARAVRRVLLASPSREAEARCARLAEKLDILLSFARGLGVFDRSPALEAASFVLSENARGAAIASADLARRAADAPGYLERRQALLNASDELAELARKGTSGEAFDAALAARERAERELIAMSREISGAELDGVEIDVPSLARWLGEHSASVSFRRFSESRLEAPPASVAGAPPTPREISTVKLCAFVVRGSAANHGSETAMDRLTLVDLGPIAPIEAAVHAWRASIGIAKGRGLEVDPSSAKLPGDSRSSGETLRRLVFDPLLAAIGERHRIVIVPDDVLHLVAFDALPLDPDGARLLGDRWKIEMRATLGELRRDENFSGNEHSLLAIGGVSYQGTEVASSPTDLPGSDGTASAPNLEVAGILRGGAWAEGFDDLPATAEEAEGISSAFDAAFGAESRSVLLERGDATREGLLEHAKGARFLHVATHGWFASESIPSWSDARPIDEKSGLGTRMSGEERLKGMGPMLLCGLALAGANLPEKGVGRAPGLVTAEELSALDLSRCELAVLSACDTARGEMRRTGQGVASLQRALQMAGARTVITSLWKVPDEATKDLMIDFYRRIWVEKKPKAQALWEAKKMLRDSKDAFGRPRYSTRDWAAWVLTGNPD